MAGDRSARKKHSGWRANAGHPTVVSWDSGTGSVPGHIAVVRPGLVNDRGPAIAQAGGTNTNYAHVSDTFGNRAVQYWVNDRGTSVGQPQEPQPQPPGRPGSPAPALARELEG